ncbi:MAG: DUF2399 domain-containing protein [Sulfuritalea sp.]|nr:DUF2399 domain-containing protein [Sulfuritalea sp.]
MKEFGVGSRRGQSIYLSAGDKTRIRALLTAANIPLDMDPGAFRVMTRAETLLSSNNEKQGGRPVKQNRVALKGLRPEQDLHVLGSPLRLPAGVHLDLDSSQIRLNGRHDVVIVVENWECFNRPDLCADELDFPGESPLVVWRGDISVSMRGLLDWLATHELPVAAFMDYDPEGLVMANALPRLSRIIAPPPAVLSRMLADKGLSERYAAQVAGCQATLDAATHADVRALWAIIRQSGRALPQEHFLHKVE